jgi:transposase
MAKENDSHQDSHRDTHKDAGSYRRMELITGTVRRRPWSAEERARIVAESFEPGANVSTVARRHNVSGGLLHCWRKKAKAPAA